MPVQKTTLDTTNAEHIIYKKATAGNHHPWWNTPRWIRPIRNHTQNPGRTPGHPT